MTRLFERCASLRRPIGWMLLVAAASAALTGCVRRRLTVRSNPPGALVYVDNQEIGTTPVSTPFTYYGTREIRLVKDGYETVTAQERILPPWYQVPPLDFLSENFWPYELRDERELNFQLAPQQAVPSDELLRRAENMRQSTHRGYVTPLPVGGPGSPVMPPPTALPPAAVPQPPPPYPMPDAGYAPGSTSPPPPPGGYPPETFTPPPPRR